MKSSDFFLAQPSRRRNIKGPRPTQLDVCHDSHKIAKEQPRPAPRRPVIIYAVSPKVIHADRSEFMSLVQRLTGAPSSSSDSASLSSSSSLGDLRGGGGGGGVASTGIVRLARFERTATSSYPSTVSNQLAEGIDAAMRTAAAAGGVSSHIPEIFPGTQHPVNIFNELNLALHGMAETPILQYPAACWELPPLSPVHARTSDHSFHF